MPVSAAPEPTTDIVRIQNPVTGQTVGSVPRDTPVAVTDLLAQMSRERPGLRIEERSEVLHAAATALHQQRERFARLISDEAGTCAKEALREVQRASRNLTVAAEEALRTHGEALQIDASGRERIAITLHEPVGLVCAITPFNRPLNQVVVKVAPAIAAGAPVIVKPSERTPLSAIAFIELLHSMGLPPLAAAVTTGLPTDVGATLLESPLIDMVTFTGSADTGAALAKQIGLKKTLMELGGNDPLIVLEDADLERTADIAAAGAFSNAGQSCRGVKRIIVVEDVADRLARLIAERARKLKLGDIYDPRTDVGAMISAEAAERVLDRCDRAVAEGAELVCGGTREGPIMVPTVLDRVSAQSRLVTKETLGPVAPILRVRDIEHALQVANGTVYGLQAGVMTKDLERFMFLARHLRCGAVNLDEGPQFESPHIPFGGVKHSGLGREGIRWAIREMSTVKTVVLPSGAGALR